MISLPSSSSVLTVPSATSTGSRVGTVTGIFQGSGRGMWIGGFCVPMSVTRLTEDRADVAEAELFDRHPVRGLDL